MAKFYGAIGYVMNNEIEPGVWAEESIEKQYSGDVIKKRVNNQTQGVINASVVMATQISVIADPFAKQNFDIIRYVMYLGKKWSVTGFDIEYPRIILTLGGIYNG